MDDSMWIPVPDDDPPHPSEQYWPEFWKGPTGQHKCPDCGRFLTKGGTCSLWLPVYRSGSYAGREHR